MPRIVTAEERASETITMRLTRGQKRLLERVAAAAGVSATELLREHVAARARELGLDAATGVGAPLSGSTRAAARASTATATAAATAAAKPASFGELAERFRAQFADRGESARRELEEALAFFAQFADASGARVIPDGLPLADLTSARLAALREALRTCGLRLSKKNLHLTYLRMLLQFGLKRGELAAGVSPADDLRAFAATEVRESWLPPPGTIS